MSSERDCSFRGLTHNTMISLAGSPASIDAQAAAHGHTGAIPKAVVSSMPRRSEITADNIRLTFAPTKERVIIVRPGIGKTYHGDTIHEVSTESGHIFLASERQLQ